MPELVAGTMMRLFPVVGVQLARDNNVNPAFTIWLNNDIQ